VSSFQILRDVKKIDDPSGEMIGAYSGSGVFIESPTELSIIFFFGFALYFSATSILTIFT